MLEELAAARILRPVDPAPGETSPRFEIFHDVLAPAILDWRAGARAGAGGARGGGAAAARTEAVRGRRSRPGAARPRLRRARRLGRRPEADGGGEGGRGGGGGRSRRVGGRRGSSSRRGVRPGRLHARRRGGPSPFPVLRGEERHALLPAHQRGTTAGPRRPFLLRRGRGGLTGRTRGIRGRRLDRPSLGRGGSSCRRPVPG